MVDSTITSANVLPKLCFVLRGAGSQEHMEQLRRSLYRFHRDTKTSQLTRQAIAHWFKVGHISVRPNSINFLKEYLITIVPDPLDPEQKKVHDQLSGYLNRISKANDIAPRTYVSQKKQIIIDSTKAVEITPNARKYLVGCYFFYHIRLVEDRDEPLALEFIRIFSRGHEIRFIIWNQNVESEAVSFEGPVVLMGDTLWFFGLSTAGNRLRVMHFRNFITDNLVYKSARLGILSSKIPSGNPDPASCRVLLLKSTKEFGRTEDVAAYAKLVVRNIPMSECLNEPYRSIFRLVSNNTSAGSMPKSTVPISENGAITDWILKVNQETIQTFCEQIRTQRIEQRAYRIWIEEGRPLGRDLEHWHRARAETAGESE